MARRLRCSSVTGPSRTCSFVAPRRRAIPGKTAISIVFQQADSYRYGLLPYAAPQFAGLLVSKNVDMSFAVETRETKMETNLFPPPEGSFLLANPGTAGNEMSARETVFWVTPRFLFYRDPRRKALEPGADDWGLLLQLDSDETAGFMWGDVGMLYYWIRKQDLAKNRFDRVWMAQQCH